MATLRSPAGCPWDREQTPRTLRPFLLEETYEALDAIDRNDTAALAGELGDVLFHCVFQAQIASEARQFDIADAVQSIIDKLVRRHPHVFKPDGRPLATATRRRSGVPTPARVLEQWEQLKAKEQESAGAKRRVLAGVPRALPALLRAHEIGTRVAAVGFDWPAAGDVLDKMQEEVNELRAALAEHPDRVAEEFGDLLFAMVNMARKLGVEAESALRQANDKFTERFAGVEQILEARGHSVHHASLEEMEAVWQQVKTQAAKPAAPRLSAGVPGPSRSTRTRRRSRG
jgi:MazG family protein